MNTADFELDEAVTGDDWTTDENITAAWNTEFPLVSAWGLKAKVGGKARIKTKERNNQEWAWAALEEDANGNELSLPVLQDVESSFYDDDFAHSSYQSLLGRFMSPSKVRDLLDDHSELFEKEWDMAENTLGDYEAKEQVFAGYTQLRLEQGPWLAVGGVRLEHTRLDLTGRNVNLDEQTWEKVKDKNAYTHVLPSMNVRYAVGSRTLYQGSQKA